MYVWQPIATAEVSGCRRLFAIGSARLSSAQLGYVNLSTVNRPVAVGRRSYSPPNERVASNNHSRGRCRRNTNTTGGVAVADTCLLSNNRNVCRGFVYARVSTSAYRHRQARYRFSFDSRGIYLVFCRQTMTLLIELRLFYVYLQTVKFDSKVLHFKGD